MCYQSLELCCVVTIDSLIYIYGLMLCVICPGDVRPNTRMTLGMHEITDNDTHTITPILTQYWFRINIHFMQTEYHRIQRMMIYYSCILYVFFSKHQILEVVVVSEFSIIYQFTVISNCYLLQFDAGGRQKVRGIWSQTRQEGASNWWPFGNEKIHKNIYSYWVSLCKLRAVCPQTGIGTFSFPSWSLDILNRAWTQS